MLFGKVNPAGRLPLTFYCSADQLLDFHDYEISHGRTYQYFRGKPLYPFGYGLSYSEFVYSRLRLDKKVAKPGDLMHATFDVTNRGPMDGEEVVQLYFHNNDPASNRPIRQLGAFRRVAIRRGKTIPVTLDLPVESLKVYGPVRKGFVVVPEEISVEVGASSDDGRLSEILSLEALPEKDQ